MGSVYKATAPDGRVVAVKLLHLHLTLVEECVKRFRHEAKLAEKLAHPNVVHVLGSGEDKGQAMRAALVHVLECGG
jgi:serine/threonine protein kinase